MRTTVILVQLALWACTSEAFYPFPQPKWAIEAKRSVDSRRGATFELEQRIRQSQSKEPRTERAAREASRLANKHAGRRPPDSETGQIGRRDNEYTVVEAEDSGKAMTSGIDQDGTDYCYMVKTQFGSKGQELYMLLDTGAGSSWVMGSACTTDACSRHTLFDSDESSTFQESSDDFSISYGSGKVKGHLAKDTIGLAGMSFDYEFGIATDTSSDFVHFAFDGILGLSMNDGANENFLQAMADDGDLDSNLFAIALNRASDGANKGEITLGFTDDSRYSGDITYIDVGNDNGDWAIPLDDASYDGGKAGVGGVLAYIDTGTSYIFASSDKVKKLHGKVPGASSSDGKSYTVPCDSDASLVFTFSGVDFEVSPKDWMSSKDSSGVCHSNIYGQEVVSGAWLLGDSFIKNVYAVFDKDKKRIGLAQTATTSSESSTNSSSSVSTPVSSSTMVDMVTMTGSSGSVITTSTTIVTAMAQTDSPGPSMGLTGPETESDGASATETNKKPSETGKSSAPGRLAGSTSLASAVCIAALSSLLS